VDRLRNVRITLVGKPENTAHFAKNVYMVNSKKNTAVGKIIGYSWTIGVRFPTGSVNSYLLADFGAHPALYRL
jgi:hypothetical protein